MNDITSDVDRNARASMLPDEWQTRVDLAALNRLSALHGWTDLIYTHTSARVPGSDDHFLLNPLLDLR